MAFSVDKHNANQGFNNMAQPRHMIFNAYDLKRFESISSGKEK